MHNDYISRLRRSIVILIITLIITWGFVAYLMWFTNQQDERIEALITERGTLGTQSSSSESEPEAGRVIWV